MKMPLVFSKRYSSIIDQDGFLTEFSHELKSRLISTLNEFNQPQLAQAGRYDGYTRNTCAWELVFESLYKLYGYEVQYARDVGDEQVYKQSPQEWCDMLELWCEQLSDSESSAFQLEVNRIFDEENCPWRLMLGLLYKIDSAQFNQDLKNKALSLLAGKREYVPVFQNAYDEYCAALQFAEAQDYENTIHQAARSFESVLKVAVGKDGGQADALTSEFMRSKLAMDIPPQIASGFKDKVLMSLPYVRNNLCVGHGKGSQEIVIAKPLALLAMDMAAALNTFVVSQYQSQVSEFVAEQAIVLVEDDDELPF